MCSLFLHCHVLSLAHGPHVENHGFSTWIFCTQRVESSLLKSTSHQKCQVSVSCLLKWWLFVVERSLLCSLQRPWIIAQIESFLTFTGLQKVIQALSGLVWVFVIHFIQGSATWQSPICV